MSIATIARKSTNYFVNHIHLQRGFVFGVILLTALFAFETFNYSTTEFALRDLLGSLSFMGLAWSTILAIAFSCIDFAGIAHLFTVQASSTAQPKGIWYLFSAWMLAATMNAMLTWWGVSIALLGHQSLGIAVVAHKTLLRVVPIFVAVLVWLIRIMIIGAFSTAGIKLFNQNGIDNTSEHKSIGKRSAAFPQPNAALPTYRPLSRANLAAKKDNKEWRATPAYHQDSSFQKASMENANAENNLRH